MSHSFSKVYLHLVFSTKFREDILPKYKLKEIHSYVAGTLKEKQCVPLAVGGTTNHIHIFYVQPRSIAMSEIVRHVKSNSSKWISENICPFNWQKGYGIFSVSPSHVERVKTYIHNQEQHHAGGISYKDEFRRIAKKYNIEIDEKYAWD